MKKYFFSAFVMALFAIGFTASDDDEVLVPGTPVDNTGIPSDDEAEPNPKVDAGDVTTTIPNIQVTTSDEDGIYVLRIDMTGVKNPGDMEWLDLYGTGTGDNQNVWVEVDGQPKGIDVINVSDQESHEVMTDIVFTVDNSGSMGQEADAIARDIIEWAQLLAKSHLNARFAVVGYGGYIDGAIDLTDENELNSYLNYSSGTYRTMHFGGSNADQLQAWAGAWTRTSSGVSSNECGAMAIKFANEYFSFRTGANRIYINFTDEPNQPNGIESYSVKFFENQINWPSTFGTVHTVYSDYQFSSNSWNYSEQPWLISEYTGGTTLFIQSNASDLNLSTITVTEAMQHSYIIRLHGMASMINDGKVHEVHVTILSKDGSVKADKSFEIMFNV